MILELVREAEKQKLSVELQTEKDILCIRLKDEFGCNLLEVKGTDFIGVYISVLTYLVDPEAYKQDMLNAREDEEAIV